MRRRRPRTIAVLGDGGWGTTLAIYLHRLGHRVRLWGAFPEYVKQVVRRRENVRFLPGIPIPRTLRITPDVRTAVDAAEIILFAVPSKYMRGVAHRVRPYHHSTSLLLSVAKGFEPKRLLRMSEVLVEELGTKHVVVLSGPNIAMEIANGYPASAVVAARDAHLAAEIQRDFMSEQFRLYTSSDLIGVELGGALKNPIAIAAGMSDGLGFGANAKAAIITRGIVEMARVGVAMGAVRETFWGLSGLGDLVTTCLGGRNRGVGEALGRGRRLDTIVSQTPMVFEGIEASKAVVALSRRYRVDIPITRAVWQVLCGEQSPRHVLHELMQRVGKAEN